MSNEGVRKALEARFSAEFARDMAELERIAAKYKLVISVPGTQVEVHGTAAIPPEPAPQVVEPEPQTEPPQHSREGEETVATLVRSFRTDPSFTGLQYKTRMYYQVLLNRIEKDCGDDALVDLNDQRIRLHHEKWTPRGLVMAHSLGNMLRRVINYGATVLSHPECKRLSVVMHHLRMPTARPRIEQLTADQVIAIRREAHERGLHSLALAQAIQFDLGLGQKVVIGEWVPEAEPGKSDMRLAGKKWLGGLRWNEIDGDLILRHATGNPDKAIEYDLKGAPMVREELARFGDERPTIGPMIICENTGRPWRTVSFRQMWREIADACEIPQNFKNSDSRARSNTRQPSNGADNQAAELVEIREAESTSKARH